MQTYWLVDQFGVDGPTALVETDGRMRVSRVVRFGPGLVELSRQQEITDAVIGRVAPTLKPLVDASELDEEGVEPHADLRQTVGDELGAAPRGARGDGAHGGPGRRSSGPGRSRSRGDR
jgi:hypothetical protein